MKPTVPPVFAEKDLNYYLRMIRGDFGETEEEGQMAKSVSASKQKNIVLVLNSQGLGQGNSSSRRWCTIESSREP